MKLKIEWATLLAGWLTLQSPAVSSKPAFDLTGYSDDNGAITVLNGGGSADPYFALQALLLAHDNGLDISAPASRFANWLVPHQKPDGTFDRFCQIANKTWLACKTADADDALLALWLRLLQTMPAKLRNNPALVNSQAVSEKALAYLFQPSRGIYMVSPVYLHGLLMDNLEVWSYKAHSKPGDANEIKKLAQAIHSTFWQPVNKHFLVSTQLEQRAQTPQFYPDHVAQIFPLLVSFPILPQSEALYYKNWMQTHRKDWLRQSDADYPWGLLAVLALRQGDLPSARCWLRETYALRHSRRWAVTDEAAFQILASRNIKPATITANCD